MEEQPVDVEDLDHSESISVSTAPSLAAAASLPAIGSISLADDCSFEDTFSQAKTVLREELPIARPKGYSGLWSVMKSAVGKELSKISMPVQFNEPISFIQRLAEDLEYSSILDDAVSSPDSLVRLALAAALSCTCFASSAEGHRVYKAFNPLLGETFELVRPGAGFRAVGEQVSHHPPITMLHAESPRGWRLVEEYRCDTKFRGTLKVIPTGLCKLEIPKYGDRITWIKPATTVHNLVFGKVWVDQEGDVDVCNHNTGEHCIMYWQPHSSAGSSYLNLTGKVFDKNKVIKYTVHGAWDKGLVLLQGDVPKDRLPSPAAALADPSSRVLWRANPTLPVAPVMYGLTKFAMSLNQPEPNVCPTDSRLRPDQRHLEDGQMDPASKEKHRLEEKQRKVRKAKDARGEVHHPRWFRAVADSDTKAPYYQYVGGYWSAKLSGSFADKTKWSDIF